MDSAIKGGKGVIMLNMGRFTVKAQEALVAARDTAQRNNKVKNSAIVSSSVFIVFVVL